MKRRDFVRLAGVAGVTGLAGCSNDGGIGDGTDTQSPTPSGSEAQRNYPDAPWQLLEGAQPEETNQIVFEDGGFKPLIAKVDPGTDIEFRNKGGSNHIVNMPAAEFDSYIRPKETVTITLEDAGTYDYVCTQHMNAVGRIIVGDGDTADGSPTTDA
jgi:plastocyanin